METNSDSDYETDDADDYTDHRLELKKVRYSRRDDLEGTERLSSKSENSSFIDEFTIWLTKECKANSNNERASTLKGRVKK